MIYAYCIQIQKYTQAFCDSHSLLFQENPLYFMSFLQDVFYKHSII